MFGIKKSLKTTAWNNLLMSGGNTHLPSVVVLHLPPSGKLQLLVRKHVEESDEVAVVLVAFKVMSVPAHLTDHVLQAGVACKHAVGTLVGGGGGRLGKQEMEK